MSEQSNSSVPSHFHIRWSGGELDYERFGSRQAAGESAKLLVRFGETYSVEEFDDSCNICAEILHRTAQGSSSD
jgi:hypothetical protein